MSLYIFQKIPWIWLGFPPDGTEGVLKDLLSCRASAAFPRGAVIVKLKIMWPNTSGPLCPLGTLTQIGSHNLITPPAKNNCIYSLWTLVQLNVDRLTLIKFKSPGWILFLVMESLHSDRWTEPKTPFIWSSENNHTIPLLSHVWAHGIWFLWGLWITVTLG